MASYAAQVVAVALTFVFVPFLVSTFRRRSIAKAAGCGEPASFPSLTFRLGTDFARLRLQKVTKESYLKFLRDLFDQYGQTFKVTVMTQPWIFTCDHENIRAVNTTLASSFMVEPFRKLPIEGWIGDGMFVSDGEKWKLSRALFKPMFGRTAISDLLSFDQHIDRMISLIPADGTSFDLQPMFKRLYLDVSTELMFGFSANCQDPQNARFDIDAFEANFEKAMAGMFTRIHSKMAALWVRDHKAWRKACAEVHSVFDTCIDLAITGEKEMPTRAGATRSMAAELSQQSNDRVFIRNQLLNVFIGAKDTAGIGISDIFFHLARYPKVWAKLRSEVLELDQQTALTFELLKSLKYCQAVLAESLRLLSPVIISVRSAKADCVLPRGGGNDGRSPIIVHKGSKIETSLSSLHYDKSIWGNDAASFRPERWLEQGSLLMKWGYIPFLGGARMCPAQQMMLTQYAYTLVRFAQTFRNIENRDPVFNFVPQIVFSQQSKNGVQVAVFRD